MNVAPDILVLFAAQHGVASLVQLVEQRLSPRTIGRARLRGVLVPVLPGVYSLGGRPVSFEGRAMAVQLHCGASSFLSGTTAAALYGLPEMPRDTIQVTIAGRVRLCLPQWVDASMTKWFEPDHVVDRPDGLRLADPLRMLLGLAGQLDDRRFDCAAEEAWRRRLITPVGVAEYLGRCRCSGRTGVARFERWLAQRTDQRQLRLLHPGHT